VRGNRGLLLLALPLLAGLGLVIALSRRGTPEREMLAPATRKVSRPSVVESGSGSISAGSVFPSPVPPAKDVASAVSTARIRSTYKNYRMAVASDNTAVQKALLPLLRRERETVMLYARDEFARATSEKSRAIARRTLDALER
jgi:hypothetical protein